MSQTRPSTLVRGRSGRLLGLVVVSILLNACVVLGAPPARADSLVAPSTGRFTLRGAGWGHGWGMSQYGAYGAARSGLSWRQILSFYYPGTSRSTLSARSMIRVWVTADRDGSLRVLPSAGLNVRDGSGGRFAVPTGAKYTSWRISRSGSGYRLSYRTADGRYVAVRTGLASSTWSFYSPNRTVRVVLLGGLVRSYRGSVALVKWGSSGRTVNRVLVEDYVRGVVPAEMPTSWAPDAVRAQAVAARSYAVRLRTAHPSAAYDLCDTTACQVYRGVSVETARGDSAVRATAGVVLTYRGGVALTQFASSNGGHSAQGAYSYLQPKPDPYDGMIRSQAWTRTLTAADIQRRWPSVGPLRGLQVISRDGAGAWGGRVGTIAIVGRNATVRVSGSTFASRFGLKSRLFTVARTAASTSGVPTTGVKPGSPYATFPRSFDTRSRADLPVIDASGNLLRYPVVAGSLRAPVRLASGLEVYRQVASVGDWNGDGYADLAVRTRTGALRLLAGSRSGLARTGTALPGRSGITSMTGVGDVDRDGHPDLATITAAGDLWVSYGDGRLGVRASRRVATGWAGQDWLRAPGDFDRDGHVDLLSLSADRLLLHRGTTSGFARPTTLATGWSGFANVTSIGDFTGDGRADVVGRTTSGRLVVFAGNGRDRLTRGATLAGSFAGTRFVV